ncbi:MAG: dockerin type I repeat-containing protein [Clostridia bacterium]|nr:dockerin type I repeat-containing protein [Clostridia bacterium]
MKKYLSLILSVILIFSSFSMLSVSAEEGTEETETNRYYFYLPEEWENEYSSTAYIFWTHGSHIPASWPGFEGIKTDIEGLYYYDVPNYVQYISWGNGVSFNENFESDIKYGRNCYIETFNNDNKVYVIDHDKTIGHIGAASPSYSGQWYYYYGNGEYGLYKEKGEEFYSCRSFGGDNPAPTLETNRYYFYMPEDWENVLSHNAGIYWWSGTNSCESLYPGYYVSGIMGGIYSYDVPKDVPEIIWNNYVNDGTSANDVLKSPGKQTEVISLDGYRPGENPLYPDGLESFDGMIYVIDYDKTTETWDSCYINGDWYYYYGDGEYGTTPEKGEIVYNTRQLGALPNKKHTNPAEDEITIYFMGGDTPAYVTYTYGDEEISESTEFVFLAKSDNDTLYFANIPENSKSIYLSDENRRTLDISKYIVNNACFSFGIKLENGKNDYKAYLLNDHLKKIDFLPGDTNENGKLSIQDATIIQKYIASILLLGGNSKKAADYNGDGKITIQDATAIQKHIANM